MPWYLGMVFFWLPSVRWLPEMLVALTNIFVQKFGIRITDKETCLATWREHLIQLEAIVPAKQLFYFNVKDGWEPLCDVSFMHFFGLVDRCVLMEFIVVGAWPTCSRCPVSAAKRCQRR